MMRDLARAVSPSAVVVRRQAADRFDLVFSPETARAFKILQLTDTHFGNPDAVKKGLRTAPSGCAIGWLG